MLKTPECLSQTTTRPFGRQRPPPAGSPLDAKRRAANAEGGNHSLKRPRAHLKFKGGFMLEKEDKTLASGQHSRRQSLGARRLWLTKDLPSAAPPSAFPETDGSLILTARVQHSRTLGILQSTLPGRPGLICGRASVALAASSNRRCVLLETRERCTQEDRFLPMKFQRNFCLLARRSPEIPSRARCEAASLRD